MSLNQKTAYHEAGQMVIAYFAGYRINSADLTPGGAGVDYSYGGDQRFVEMIFGYNGESDLSMMAHGIQVKVTQIAYKLCNIIFGGPVAATYLDVGIDFAGELPVKLVDPDLSGLKQIDYFMGDLYPDEELNFLSTNFQGISEMIAMPLFWEAITLLGAALMEQGKLSGEEIETILTDSRFFEGLKMLDDEQIK